MPTTQEQFWRSDFGDAYTSRNRVDWRLRVPFWQAVLGKTEAQSVLEVGCNAGWNLRAMLEIDPGLSLCGVDVNKAALAEAGAPGSGVDVVEMAAVDVGETWPGGFDLTFTAGVLIHIPPAQLQEAMTSIAAASRRWVLAVEYAADVEQEIEYRGHAERLWKRPFGDLYQSMGLRLVKQGDAGPGFDRCKFWLLERT